MSGDPSGLTVPNQWPATAVRGAPVAAQIRPPTPTPSRAQGYGEYDADFADLVDEWGRQSFPASDPPANW